MSSICLQLLDEELLLNTNNCGNFATLPLDLQHSHHCDRDNSAKPCQTCLGCELGDRWAWYIKTLFEILNLTL